MVKLIEHKWQDWLFTWANNVGEQYFWNASFSDNIDQLHWNGIWWISQGNCWNYSVTVNYSIQIWVISDYLNGRGGCSSREAVHSTIANRYWLTESAPNDKRLSIPFFVFCICILCGPLCFCWMTMLSTIQVSGVVKGLMNSKLHLVPNIFLFISLHYLECILATSFSVSELETLPL